MISTLSLTLIMCVLDDVGLAVTLRHACPELMIGLSASERRLGMLRTECMRTIQPSIPPQHAPAYSNLLSKEISCTKILLSEATTVRGEKAQPMLLAVVHAAPPPTSKQHTCSLYTLLLSSIAWCPRSLFWSHAYELSGYRFSLRFTPSSSRTPSSSCRYSSYWPLFSTFVLMPEV